MNDETLVEQVVDIRAPAEIVFDLLTTAEGLLEWIAVEAQSEVVPGGRIRWRHENGDIMSGRFVEIDRPRRIAFTYGWEKGGLDVPPGSTLVTIDLTESDGTTRLHLLHSRLPVSMTEDHRRGWTWFLGKLAERAAAKSGGSCDEEER